jgi:hypothetical protein
MGHASVYTHALTLRVHTLRASAPRVCHMYQLTVENGGMSRHLIQCIGAQIRVGLGVEVRAMAALLRSRGFTPNL